MFILTVLEKINEKRLKFSQGNVTVLWKMANYEETRFKLTNSQVNKLKPAAATTIARQETEIRNTFADNMSTDLGALLGN